jgi:hypothetical protein
VYATLAVKNIFESVFVSLVIVTVFVTPAKLRETFVIQLIAAVFSEGMSCGVAMLYTLYVATIFANAHSGVHEIKVATLLPVKATLVVV